MKTYSTVAFNDKAKTDSFKNIIIEDESGIDTFRVRKDLFFSTLASHLRQISAPVIATKTFA